MHGDPLEFDATIHMCARVVPADGSWSMVRCGPLSAYDLELIAEDAARVGPGGHVELTLEGLCGHAADTRLRDSFSGLRGKGIDVRVRHVLGDWFPSAVGW